MSEETTIGFRLKVERERIGLDQASFAGLAGIARNSQHRYELGDRTPDIKYLKSIACAGVDIIYIVTGERIENTPTTPMEFALLDNYRHSPVDVRIGVSKLLAQTGKALERANTIEETQSTNEGDKE